MLLRSHFSLIGFLVASVPRPRVCRAAARWGKEPSRASANGRRIIRAAPTQAVSHLGCWEQADFWLVNFRRFQLPSFFLERTNIRGKLGNRMRTARVCKDLASWRMSRDLPKVDRTWRWQKLAAHALIFPTSFLWCEMLEMPKVPGGWWFNGYTWSYHHINGWIKAYTCLYIYINIACYKNGSMGFQLISWRLVGLMTHPMWEPLLRHRSVARGRRDPAEALARTSVGSTSRGWLSFSLHWNRHDGVYVWPVYECIWYM